MTLPLLNQKVLTVLFVEHSLTKYGLKPLLGYNAHDIVPDTYFAQCMKCNNYSIWHGEQLIHPSGGNAPLPHADLPEDLKKIARLGLLFQGRQEVLRVFRLTIEKLTNTILEENKNKSLNSKIEAFGREEGSSVGNRKSIACCKSHRK